MKYFLINKELDYKRGVPDNACYESGFLEPGPENRPGSFFSRIFDSGEDGTVWHRFTMEGERQGDSSVQLSFYCTDQTDLMTPEGKQKIGMIVSSSEFSLEEKKERLKPILRKTCLFSEDLLLHELKGRYLLLLIELYPQGRQKPEIGPICIYFPKETWMKYLPAVYGKDKTGASFTERYLGIFQSFYDDMDQAIRRSARLMSLEDASTEWLQEVAEWLQIRDVYIWPEEKLRRLLKMAVSLFRRSGTVGGMLEFIRLFTGETPLLVECGLLDGEDERSASLYGNDPNQFILMIRECYLTSVSDYRAMQSIVEKMKPANMEVRIVALRPFLFLGQYSYLGINSQIGKYQPFRLDGQTALSLSAIGETDKRRKEA